MFLDGSIDLFTGGKVYDLCLKSVGVNAEPFGLGTGSAGLNNGLDLLGAAALLADSNNISCLNIEVLSAAGKSPLPFKT